MVFFHIMNRKTREQGYLHIYTGVSVKYAVVSIPLGFMTFVNEASLMKDYVILRIIDKEVAHNLTEVMREYGLTNMTTPPDEQHN